MKKFKIKKTSTGKMQLIILELLEDGTWHEVSDINNISDVTVFNGNLVVNSQNENEIVQTKFKLKCKTLKNYFRINRIHSTIWH